MGCDLKLQRKNFMLIINTHDYDSNTIITKKDLKGALCKFDCIYFFIEHDQDINDSGELKNKHYHVVILLKNRIRASTLLKNLSMYLFINEFNIQIDIIDNVNASIQYLIHKNDLDKYQYSMTQITTNNPLYLNGAMSDNMIQEYDALDLINICESSRTRKEVLIALGCKNYIKYRSIIDMLMCKK